LKRQVDTTYDEVAELYDAVFQDIKVRKDEWNWLLRHLPKDIEQKTIVDIGCGNGALLKELSPQVLKGIGLDLSDKILKRAELLNKDNKNITFNKLDGPLLPLEDHSVDIFISLLSFRYLDWDPLMDELKRVLKPGGQVLIIDMVAVPVKLKDSPRFLFNKIKQFFGKQRNKEFKQSLNRLVSHPDWSKMLKFNPIRAEHEMKWYLESRFPGQKIEKINIGYHSSILAFDSGPISNIADINLSYP
jgi:ubiquinone/menaquinone biosynthesis C-methylase UbiE